MAAAAARTIGKLRPPTTSLFVCDVQERFREKIWQMHSVIPAAKFMLDVARTLDVPCVVTEQYPRALGRTVAELGIGESASSPLPHLAVFEKKLFSMCTDDVLTHLRGFGAGRRDVLLLGIEGHVCVLQTCLDLVEHGYTVHLVVDAISSQRPLDRAVGIQRMQQAGALVTTVEAAAFELMGSADHPNFKAISQLAKDLGAAPGRQCPFGGLQATL